MKRLSMTGLARQLAREPRDLSWLDSRSRPRQLWKLSRLTPLYCVSLWRSAVGGFALHYFLPSPSTLAFLLASVSKLDDRDIWRVEFSKVLPVAPRLTPKTRRTLCDFASLEASVGKTRVEKARAKAQSKAQAKSKPTKRRKAKK